jgi:hypothetical protein
MNNTEFYFTFIGLLVCLTKQIVTVMWLGVRNCMVRVSIGVRKMCKKTAVTNACIRIFVEDVC